MFALFKFKGWHDAKKIIKSLSEMGQEIQRKELKFPSKIWHWTIRKEMQWSGIRKITRFSHFLMTTKPNSLSLALSIISSYIHISLHTHTCAFVFNIWQDADLWITQCQNKETRFTPSKKENLLKNLVKLGSLLSLKENHTRNPPFESNSPYESSLFLPGSPFDQI